MALTAVDLALYLGVEEIHAERADLLLSQATVLAESVVKPLPAAASAIVLAMAGRAYANPQGVSSETVGPYTVSRPQAGLYMTKAETAALKRIAGRGGAFTIDPTPADASPAATWPLEDADLWPESRLWSDGE
ncbi:hypothetical protein Sme01_02890 [Sphaerisporangium melleum]|uniref:Head-to-tail adaptor n=1 Tax=Sphaerisporangium melleum TaxID=321316 RepID=A0A917QP19_9ACTN|nr:hypothetical protein [Sphaerisporangium melleum]GGK61244.1 hypothetical protein GCM10007964_00430 [Sphaerisporangium melleum]GII67813.1 hypothetical protein Sme01_02890 [Sphaerisporangium melleum]